jgi:RHS repeat-associated protein
LLWDEENRLEAIDENGFVSNYWYDAAGERTVKTSGESEQMFVNALFSGGNTGTANFTAYVNPYIVVSKGGHYTKHIYIGSQRIVSKLGDLDSYGADPRRIEYAGANVDGALVDYKGKYEALQQTIKDRYAIFEVPYLGKDNDDYVNGQGFCCDDTPQGNALKATRGNDNPELFQYYYHSDHLGSTSLITNLDGEVVQHVEYVPFGEVFIEERNNTWNTPYLFNAKELDEETGLYYYGARYYDPRTSVWLSTDPLQEKYPNVNTYGTYSYTVPNLVNSSISILEDGTYRFIYRAEGFGRKYLSEGMWKYIGNDKYCISTMYNHNFIPMLVTEKSTGADSLVFVFTEGIGLFPTEELYVDSVCYFFMPGQDTLKLSKTAIKDSFVISVGSKVDPNEIVPIVNHPYIKTVHYRIKNHEADLFEISIPVRCPFTDFFAYHYLEERSDTIEVRNGKLILDGAIYYLK